MARQTFDEWLDGQPEDLAGVAVRAGMGKGDRSPEYVAFFVFEIGHEWAAKKDLRPELIDRTDLEPTLIAAIADNGGEEPGTMIRLVAYGADGKKLRGWTHTQQAALRTDSWREMPSGDRADQITARGLAEAVAGITRSQVNFLDKTTDVLAVMGQAVADSQAAQTDLMDQVLNIQRDWLDTMAEDIESAAEDLQNSPEAREDGWKESVLEILKDFTGFGSDPGGYAEPELAPDPEPDPEPDPPVE